MANCPPIPESFPAFVIMAGIPCAVGGMVLYLTPILLTQAEAPA